MMPRSTQERFTIGAKAQALVAFESVCTKQARFRIREALMKRGLGTLLMTLPDDYTKAFEYLIRVYGENKDGTKETD
jgi:hypothetical protein